MFLAQTQVTETVQRAIDAGTLGIAVMLTVVLIILGAGFYIFISKVITPLINQLILLITSQKEMVETASKAVEHSNETNRLMTVATNEQTGEIRLLRTDFKNYQTLQSDTVSALVDRFDKFDSSIEGLKVLIDRNAGDHGDIKALLVQMVEGMKLMQTDIKLLIPAPIKAEVTIVPPTLPPTDTPKPDANEGGGLPGSEAAA